MKKMLFRFMLSITVVFTLLATAFVVMANPYDDYDDYNPAGAWNQNTDYGQALHDHCNYVVFELASVGIIAWGHTTSAVTNCRTNLHGHANQTHPLGMFTALIRYGQYLGFEEGVEHATDNNAENTIGVLLAGIASGFTAVFSFFVFIGTNFSIYGVNIFHILLLIVGFAITVAVLKWVL